MLSLLISPQNLFALHLLLNILNFFNKNIDFSLPPIQRDTLKGNGKKYVLSNSFMIILIIKFKFEKF